MAEKQFVPGEWTQEMNEDAKRLNIPWQRIAIQAVLTLVLVTAATILVIPVNGRTVRSYTLEAHQHREAMRAQAAELIHRETLIEELKYWKAYARNSQKGIVWEN